MLVQALEEDKEKGENVLDGKYHGAGNANMERKRGYERVAATMSK